MIIYGVVLPKLMAEWQLSPLQAGALGSYALFGMMFGALFFGPLSDKIGRRTIMICVLIFSGMTFLNGFARDPGSSEYLPLHRRPGHRRRDAQRYSRINCVSSLLE